MIMSYPVCRFFPFHEVSLVERFRQAFPSALVTRSMPTCGSKTLAKAQIAIKHAKPSDRIPACRIHIPPKSCKRLGKYKKRTYQTSKPTTGILSQLQNDKDPPPAGRPKREEALHRGHNNKVSVSR